MRSTRSINSRGQVSFESILLWAGFLSVLGLFLPVFNQAMDAQKLQVEKERFIDFSTNLSDSLHLLSFYAPGSSLSVSFSSLENVSLVVEGSVIIVSWSPPSLGHSLEQTIESPYEIENNLSSNFKTLILRRESNLIILESE